ncbi:SDR family NAD(P)-dependent oxidoreductase [Aureliella helgolandensis]|uniref:Benzil reductase ((S)-benzoin forming) n=1 Tax=Aureliella helgolandensis TaxID=2527968 RepID=A0A518G5I9_9BACT|nr:SDR family NAD(P)-dependent oxidoreductase [Aureliella helgolandensis]QDV23848.1 Benzil reductase ((S)-benzoin forming) [Aureliella helgolandensis]
MVYIVTGASRGIGNAVAAALAARNYPVLAVAISEARLQMLADRFPDVVTPVAADLSTPAGMDRVVAAIQHGSILGGIVHAAGSLIPLEPFLSLNPASLAEHFQIHVTAQISLCQRITEKASVARMLFLDSYSASTPRDGWAAYSIIKAAAQMAARCAAQELTSTTIARVFPGAVNTRIVESVLESNTATATQFAQLVAKGEVAAPEEVASFIVALLVDASRDLVKSFDAWDYNNPEHRLLLESCQPKQ